LVKNSCELVYHLPNKQKFNNLKNALSTFHLLISAVCLCPYFDSLLLFIVICIVAISIKKYQQRSHLPGMNRKKVDQADGCGDGVGDVAVDDADVDDGDAVAHLEDSLDTLFSG
jgi:hypothetical protein